METKSYNGWSNYETWNIKLWMDNDEGSYNYWNERAQEVYDDATADGPFSREERATLDLADAIKEYHEEAAEEFTKDKSGPFCDLLSAALSEVNWYEIAEGYIEEVEKEEPETEEVE